MRRRIDHIGDLCISSEPGPERIVDPGRDVASGLYRGTHDHSGVRPHRHRRRPRRPEHRRSGEAGRPVGRRSSRANWSAANARTGPASRRRRCCAAVPLCVPRAMSRARGRRCPDRSTWQRPCGAATRWFASGTTRIEADWLREAGIDLVRGHGRLTGERQVTVESADGGEPVTLVARHAVAVSTGSAALLPDIPGLKDASPWTSRDATGVQNVPASLAILGGGVVGCEMATLYASFGCAVTLIARSGLLGSMEPFAGEAVADSLRQAGAEVRTGVEVDAVSREADGEVVLALSDGSRGPCRRGARGDRTRAADRRPGARERRTGARIMARRGRHPSRPWRRVAVRGRRRQPPRPPHAPGQVPGPRGRRRHRGTGARAATSTTRRGARTSPPPIIPPSPR